jgi:alkylation response protein AidB-like acyl-CoA dehydrogenase
MATTGLRTATFSEVELSGCEVPAAQVLAAEGDGFLRLLRFVQRWERASAVALLVGWMGGLLDASVRAARETTRFGRPIGNFGDVRGKLSDMRIAHAACRRLGLRSAWQLEQGDAVGDRDIAVAKVFVSEAAERVAHAALEIHGCRGLASDTFVERAHRDAALLRHVGGNNAVLRSVIAGSLLEMG